MKLVPNIHFHSIQEPAIFGPGAPAAKYIGGEQRHDAAGNAAYVALAADCTGASVKDLVASHLLAKVLGAGARSKYGNGAGLLQKATGSKDVTSIIHEYADASMLGAAIKCDAANAGELVSKVAATLRSVSVTDAEVKAAKKALLDAIAQVTLGDVQAAAKKVSNGKFSMAAVGNLGTVPYLDTL